MDRIVGRIIASLLLFGTIIVCGAIRLDVRSADGQLTDYVVLGQPVILDVTIDQVQGSVQAPTIDGIEKFSPRRTGMYMSNINGVSTVKYSYQLSIDQPGTYTIGPAHLTHQKNLISSQAVTLTVGHDSAPASSSKKDKKKKKKSAKAFLQLETDLDHVVVGQKIEGKLRFYYQDPSLSLSQIGQPDIVGFDVHQFSKPVGGTTEIKGKLYRYAEWVWDMYPSQTGELTIPAYSADYEIPLNDNSFMTGFFLFTGNRSERKRIYSNALKVMVDPLPMTLSEGNTVGSFTSFTASITPSVAKEGEGMVLTLDLVGDGNMQAIKAPIVTMPSELKYYNSHATISDEPGNKLQTKHFEFIVQGVKAGDWKIPEQSFTFFDVKKKEYVTLQTQSLFVSIQPSLSKDHGVSEAKQSSSAVREKSDILPLNVQGPWYPIAAKQPLPWIVFFLLLTLPFWYIVYDQRRCIFDTLLLRFFGGIKKKAYKSARAKIIACEKSGDGKKLYGIFVDYFALIVNESSHSLSQGMIEEYLRGYLGFSLQERDQWRLFFDSLACVAYADHHNENVYELCRMALQWLDRLQKQL